MAISRKTQPTPLTFASELADAKVRGVFMYPKPQAPMKSQDDQLVFSSGQIIYELGDPGGDVFIVQKGEVEIFHHKSGKEIVSSTISSGGFLGTLTSFHNENCIDSARALGEVVLKRIRQNQIKRLTNSLPSWMLAVLADFIKTTIKLKSQVAELSDLNLELKRNQVNFNFIASRLGSLLQASFALLSKGPSNTPTLYLKDAIEFAKKSLVFPEELLSEILAVMDDCNMIQIKSSPEQREKFLLKSDIEAMFAYSNFFLASKKGRIKRIVESNLSSKDIKTIGGIVNFAKKMGLDQNKECYLSLEDLENSMEKMLSIKFDLEAINMAEHLNLLQFAPGKQKITFAPNDLMQTISFLGTYKRLEKLEMLHGIKGENKSSAA